MEKSKYKLSFCIPEYNCIDGAKKLVTQLLSNPNKDFQVVVVDDCSNDGTYEELLKINDKRFKLIQNKANVGAKRNWYKSLINGDGEWLYLVMGRDKLAFENIDKLISILDICEKEDFLYLKDTDEKLLNTNTKLEQINNMVIFGDHPTGAIYNRKALISLGDKEEYFKTEFTYPEILLASDIINNHNAKYINSGVFVYEVNIDKEKVKSNFEKNNKILFYYPERRIEQCLVILDTQKKLLNNNKLEDRFEYILLNQYRRLISSISIEWIFFNSNKEWAHHYDKEVRLVSINEIIKNENKAYREISTKYHINIGVVSRLKMYIYNLYFLLKSIIRVAKVKKEIE